MQASVLCATEGIRRQTAYKLRLLKEPYYALLPQVDMVLCGLKDMSKMYFGQNTTRRRGIGEM